MKITRLAIDSQILPNSFGGEGEVGKESSDEKQTPWEREATRRKRNRETAAGGFFFYETGQTDRTCALMTPPDTTSAAQHLSQG